MKIYIYTVKKSCEKICTIIFFFFLILYIIVRKKKKNNLMNVKMKVFAGLNIKWEFCVWWRINSFYNVNIIENGNSPPSTVWCVINKKNCCLNKVIFQAVFTGTKWIFSSKKYIHQFGLNCSASPLSNKGFFFFLFYISTNICTRAVKDVGALTRCPFCS